MREFAYGTEQQYQMLRESLEDHLCHVYRCTLPGNCSKSACRIGFEKEGKTYALFIDKGITCSRSDAARFQEWLSIGTLRFLDFSGMKEYLRSMKFLFQ